MRFIIAITILMALCLPLRAQSADSTDALIKALMDKGLITQEDIEKAGRSLINPLQSPHRLPQL